MASSESVMMAEAEAARGKDMAAAAPTRRGLSRGRAAAERPWSGEVPEASESLMMAEAEAARGKFVCPPEDFIIFCLMRGGGGDGGSDDTSAGWMAAATTEGAALLVSLLLNFVGIWRWMAGRRLRREEEEPTVEMETRGRRLGGSRRRGPGSRSPHQPQPQPPIVVPHFERRLSTFRRRSASSSPTRQEAGAEWIPLRAMSIGRPPRPALPQQQQPTIGSPGILREVVSWDFSKPAEEL